MGAACAAGTVPKMTLATRIAKVVRSIYASLFPFLHHFTNKPLDDFEHFGIQLRTRGVKYGVLGTVSGHINNALVLSAAVRACVMKYFPPVTAL
jgi:hypothetical protein